MDLTFKFIANLFLLNFQTNTHAEVVDTELYISSNTISIVNPDTHCMFNFVSLTPTVHLDISSSVVRCGCFGHYCN